ncbi:Hypothetical protein PHPALM_11159, partial [Phytophthora palmivora]
MFAFAGEVNWPEDREITSVTTMENEKERGVYLSECGTKEWSTGEPSDHKTEVCPKLNDRPEVSSQGRSYSQARDWGGGRPNANVSVISANYAKRLRLREVPDHGRSLEVRGINPGVLETRRRALMKITLGWERVYEFEMWIINHSAGVDVVLGTDFMIPAGVRLDLFHGTARLPDEVMRLVPTVTKFRRGHPTWIRLTNVTPRVANCSKHDSVVLWVPIGELPREPGYILAYAESRDETLFERERNLYECWLAEQPPAVE